MKIVVAPDSYKGTLDQYEVANVMSQSLEEQGHSCVMKPMSDGGDGLLQCFRSEGYNRVVTNVTGPEGRTVEAEYYMKEGTAVIETAEACGLHLITDSHPSDRTTFGVGELLMHAADQGAEHIILGLGGSATNDGGYGMFMALGGAAIDEADLPLGVFNRDIPKISELNVQSLRRFEKIKLTIASDVTHPLLGPKGAVHTFGPQKGIDEADLDRFADMLVHLAEKAADAFLVDHTDNPGAGAAGGLGWMLLNIGAEMQSGGELIAEMIHLEKEIMEADAVITGEGKSDRQTLGGKAPSVVADLAKKHHKPCHLVSGQVTEDLSDYFDGTHALVDAGNDVDQVISDTAFHLNRKMKEIFPK
ncbi:glycerate kinase [Salinicoccus roseus]|uniref:glycerate kinase n=1 Tax=Salinicoccus roseus TaxID=45670 RepID=UPI00230140F0|nr:glycerate kinase [Salinicoccus roseus]